MDQRRLIARWYAIVLCTTCFGWPMIVGIPQGWMRCVWFVVALLCVGWSMVTAHRIASTIGLDRHETVHPWFLCSVIGGGVLLMSRFPLTFFTDEEAIALPGLTIAMNLIGFVGRPFLIIMLCIVIAGIVRYGCSLRSSHTYCFCGMMVMISATLGVVHQSTETLVLRYPPMLHVLQVTMNIIGGGNLTLLRLLNVFWSIMLGCTAWYCFPDWSRLSRSVLALAVCLTPLGLTYRLLLYQGCGEITFGILLVALVHRLLQSNENDHVAFYVGATLVLWILYRPTAIVLMMATVAIIVYKKRQAATAMILHLALPIGLLTVATYLAGSFQYSFLMPSTPRSFEVLRPFIETLRALPGNLSMVGLIILGCGTIGSWILRPEDRTLLGIAWAIGIIYTGTHEILTVEQWYGYGRFNLLLLVPLGICVASCTAWAGQQSKYLGLAVASGFLMTLATVTPWRFVEFLQGYRSVSHAAYIDRSVTGGAFPSAVPKLIERLLAHRKSLTILAPSTAFLDLFIARKLLTPEERAAIVERSNLWMPSERNRPVVISISASGTTYRTHEGDMMDHRLQAAAVWALAQPNVETIEFGRERVYVVW